MLALLMHLKHAYISFGRTKQLKFDFTADLTGTRNRSVEVKKSDIVSEF